MKKRPFLSNALLLALGALAMVGCGTSTATRPSPPPAAPDSAGSQATSAIAGHTDASADAAADEMKQMQASLAKLAPEDRASAEKQHFCPVSGKMLGAMGAPFKAEVNGQTVWLCCSGCESQLLASPNQYLAKLKAH